MDAVLTFVHDMVTENTRPSTSISVPASLDMLRKAKPRALGCLLTPMDGHVQSIYNQILTVIFRWFACPLLVLLSHFPRLQFCTLFSSFSPLSSSHSILGLTLQQTYVYDLELKLPGDC